MHRITLLLMIIVYPTSFIPQPMLTVLFNNIWHVVCIKLISFVITFNVVERLWPSHLRYSSYKQSLLHFPLQTPLSWRHSRVRDLHVMAVTECWNWRLLPKMLKHLLKKNFIDVFLRFYFIMFLCGGCSKQILCAVYCMHCCYGNDYV